MEIQVKNLQETAETTVHTVTGTAHKMLQIGLGAMVVVQGEIVDLYHGMNEFADKLVERGEKVEQENMERITGRLDERRKQTKKVINRVEDNVNGRAESLLNRINLPTTSDIKGLNKQITSLSRKVDKIRKEQEQEATAA